MPALHQTISHEQPVIGALKLRHPLEPFHEAILQLDIVLDDIEANRRGRDNSSRRPLPGSRHYPNLSLKSA